MDYHLFKKTIKINNTKHWYYWYYDNLGNQKQKSCLHCSTKREAELYISQLPPLKDISDCTVAEICRNMYIPGSEHCRRREQFGKSVKLITLTECRHYIECICKKFGKTKMTELSSKKVEKHLINDTHSGSWKNRYLEIVSDIFDEAIWQGIHVQKPTFTKFKRNSKKQSVLSTQELKAFLRPENFSSEMFYTFFFVCVSAGLRLGEIRAMRKCQFQKKKNIIIIDGFLGRGGTRNPFNKTGSIDNPRFRATLIPDITVNILDSWIRKNTFEENDYIFTFQNKPIRQEYAEKEFTRALKNAHINTTDRKISPHSLRYTYVTRTRRLVDTSAVMLMAGHSSEAMSDYYTRFELDETIKKLEPMRSNIDQFFE